MRFYERRARRILPALFVVMAACVPFALLLMVPDQLRAFGASLASVSLFASNILFWREDGFFEAAAELKPLLHTWSLAIEEQYYLLFPPILAFLFRFGRQRAFWLVAASALASFVACIVVTRMSPTAGFYLPVTRGWELLAGSLCAFLGARRGNNFLSAAGLAMIVAPIFLYDSLTPFRSYYALSPVAGTCLVVLYAERGTWVARFLSLAPLVGIGLISYSAYLWHQPLFAFARLRSIAEPSPVLMMALAVASLLLAFVSWKYVENPFRDRTRFSARRIFRYSSTGIAAFVLLGASIWIMRGVPERFDDRQRALLAMNDYRQTMTAYGLRRCFIDYDQDAANLKGNGCFAATDRPRVIVFGDSEAAHLIAGVRETFASRHIDQWTGTSCRAFDFDGNSDRCASTYRTFLSEILPLTDRQDTILIGSNWFYTLDEIGPDEFARVLSRSFNALASAKARVIVIGNTPDFDKPPLDSIVMRKLDSENQIYLPARDYRPADGIVRREAERFGLEFFEASKVFCKPDSLDCLALVDGQPTFFDSNHLAPKGSRMLVRALSQHAPR